MKFLCLLVSLCLALPSAAAAAERIVSTGGALTEIIYLLGAEAHLVGTDTTSYYPPEAEKTAKVGYQRALSTEGIVSLAPDLILLTDEAGPPPVIAQLEAAKIPMLKLQAGRSMDDVFANITAIAAALGKEDKGTEVISAITAQLDTLKAATGQDNIKKPRVLIVHMHMGGAPSAAGKDTAADGIIALSGGQNVIMEFDGYKPLTPEAAIAYAPDLIVVAAPQADKLNDNASLISHPSLIQTPAGKNGHVIAMDALYLLGFGPRTADAAQQLREAYKGL